jgi:NTP pyrophosphatase (non-canonical NTP hydrolase)
LEPECRCHLGQKRPIDYKTLAEYEVRNRSNRPKTLDDWQRHFQGIYPRYEDYDYKRTFAHLIEEVGEVSEAYRIRYFYPDNLPHEIADVLTWIFGITNYVDKKNPSQSVALAKLTLETYPNQCEKCSQKPCKCPPQPLMKVSEPFDERATTKASSDTQSVPGVDKVQPRFSITISNSSIGSLTFGDVLGRIQSSVTTLRAAHQDNVAEALQAITESVAATPNFGDAQQDVIEQISELAVQATRPLEERKLGVVKAIWIGLNTALASSANVATIWDQWGPVIKKFFGI